MAEDWEKKKHSSLHSALEKKKCSSIFSAVEKKKLSGILSALEKKKRSSILSAMLCLAHALPLACRSESVMKCIFLHSIREGSRNFHADWTLDGRNNDIIQPARDAVLNYYKVRATIPPPTVLALNPDSTTLFIL